MPEFTDYYGNNYIIRKSEIDAPPAIWIGPKELELSEYVPNQGYVPITLPKDCCGNHFILLNQAQVAALLPMLQRFVATGEI